jgi:hypothetical protein
MVVRANFTAALIDGPDWGWPPPYDPVRLPKKYGLGTDPDAVLTFHHRLLWGTDPGDELRKRLGGVTGRKVVTALLSSPEGQLG